MPAQRSLRGRVGIHRLHRRASSSATVPMITNPPYAAMPVHLSVLALHLSAGSQRISQQHPETLRDDPEEGSVRPGTILNIPKRIGMLRAACSRARFLNTLYIGLSSCFAGTSLWVNFVSEHRQFRGLVWKQPFREVGPEHLRSPPSGLRSTRRHPHKAQCSLQYCSSDNCQGE